MRLSTINENLAALFRQASDTNDARQIFEEIFQACLRRMKNVRYDLPENDRLAILMAAGERPQGVDFSLLSAEMDEKYFDAEEGGRDGEAAEYFALARLMSALSFAVTATEIAAYAEATYEALMALPNPKEDSAELLRFRDQSWSIATPKALWIVEVALYHRLCRVSHC